MMCIYFQIIPFRVRTDIVPPPKASDRYRPRIGPGGFCVGANPVMICAFLFSGFVPLRPVCVCDVTATRMFHSTTPPKSLLKRFRLINSVCLKKKKYPHSTSISALCSFLVGFAQNPPLLLTLHPICSHSTTSSLSFVRSYIGT